MTFVLCAAVALSDLLDSAGSSVSSPSPASATVTSSCEEPADLTALPAHSALPQRSPLSEGRASSELSEQSEHPELSEQPELSEHPGDGNRDWPATMTLRVEAPPNRRRRERVHCKEQQH